MSRFMGSVPRVFTSRSKQPSSPYALVRKLASQRMPAGFLSVAMLAILVVVTVGNWLGATLEA